MHNSIVDLMNKSPYFTNNKGCFMLKIQIRKKVKESRIHEL
jgi:hypothetical protein